MQLPATLKKHMIPATSCPVCGHGFFHEFLRINGMCFFECEACRFRFMNPHLSDKGMRLLYENSEILAQVNPALEKYYEYEAGSSQSRTAKDHRNVLGFVSKHLCIYKENPKLFEVGFGSGAFLKEAAIRKWQVDGIDTSQTNTSKLREAHKWPVKQGLFETFNAPANQYDAVALWDVIEHTMIPRAYLKKIHRMLVPGGWLILATPNIGGLLNGVAETLYNLSKGRVQFAVSQLYVLEHVGYYNVTTLKRLAIGGGFAPKKIFFTDTDLDRYAFSFYLKSALRIFFTIARLLQSQNRVILLAQKGNL